MFQKLLQSMFRLRFGSRVKKFAGIPGPTPSYPIGTIGDFYGADPWEVFADYGAKYGGMSLAWLGGSPTVVLNNPRLIGEVLDTNAKEYYKDYPIRALRPVLRGTIFNFNKPEWDRLRKGHPCKIEAFDRWLPTQFSVIKKVAERHLDAMLSTDQEMEPVDKMQRLCFDAFNACACGPDFEDGGFENFYILSEMATFRMKFPQFMLIPPIRPRFHRAMKLHYGAYDKAVKKARQNPDASANDLLHVFLRQGTDFSDSEIVDSLSDFQAGGDISTASALVNTFYLLSNHPVIAKRLHDDLAAMKRRNPDFDQAALDQVPLLDHVLRESLRMIPPVAINSRNTLKDRTVTLGGHALPPNTTVMILTKAVQRSAKHWKDPDTFNPDRWANGGVEANPLGSEYFFPFGRGPRTCAGADFAMFCMKIILASILSRASLKTSGSFRGIYHCGVVEAKLLRGRVVAHAR